MKFKNTVVILGAVALAMSAGTALAFERGQVRETKSMAQELAASAERVNATAHRQEVHFRGSERRMLVALERFSGSARQFSNTLETYFRSPAEVRQTLTVLNDDSTVVNQTIRRARPMRAVLADWDHCMRLLERINARFDLSSETTAAARSDREQRYYESGGRRYPRNGDRYYRDGQWVEIAAQKTTVKSVLRGLLTDR